MTALANTDLTTADKAHFASTLIAGQGDYGNISQTAAAFGVSRPTAYRTMDEALHVLESYYEATATFGLRAATAVDDAQLRRFVVGHYVMGHNSIRNIEVLIPLSYPGVTLSYGTIQAILIVAKFAAARFNATVDLSQIRAVAVDEMYSQRNPVLAGVCLDTGYLLGLSLEESRDAETWERFFEKAKTQSLNLDVVVKDAAAGIAAGVTKAFPNAEQRDDMFHGIYEMGKVRRILESKAYAAIARLDEAKAKREKVKCKRHSDPAVGIKARRSAGSAVGAAQRHCTKTMALHDTFERAMRQAVQAMQIVDLDTGEFNTSGTALERLTEAAKMMQKLKYQRCKKVGKYLQNRAAGLVLYIEELHRQFQALAGVHGDLPVNLAAMVWQLRDDLTNGRHHWRRAQMTRELRGARRLLKLISNDSDHVATLTRRVDEIMLRRHRASSAIEGFNAALRPFLYLHKGVTQGFLDLFQTYHNLKTRRTGRYKGTSAYECATGEKPGDWLTMIGFPPSSGQFLNAWLH
jgi:hypothetical protein